MEEWKKNADEWNKWLKTKEDEFDNQGPIAREPFALNKQKAELEVMFLTI